MGRLSPRWLVPVATCGLLAATSLAERVALPTSHADVALATPCAPAPASPDGSALVPVDASGVRPLTAREALERRLAALQAAIEADPTLVATGQTYSPDAPVVASGAATVEPPRARQHRPSAFRARRCTPDRDELVRGDPARRCTPDRDELLRGDPARRCTPDRDELLRGDRWGDLERDPVDGRATPFRHGGVDVLVDPRPLR